MRIDIAQIQKGDVVRFKAYALRVEAAPIVSASSVQLHGRSTEPGCPLVTKRFMKGRTVDIDARREPLAE